MTKGCTQEFRLRHLEVQYIHLNRNRELFEQAYEQLFVPTWPEFTRLDSPAEMLNSTDPDAEKFIMIVGKNLSSSDPEKREIMGFKYDFYFPQSQTGLMVYIVVNEKYRAKSIGRHMMELASQGLAEMAEARGQSLKGVYFEIDDPAKIDKCSGGLSPPRCKALFEIWGARQVDIDYIRPDYSDDGTWQMDQKYLLMSYPYKGKHPASRDTEDFLIDVYKYTTGEKDRDLIRSFPEIKTMAGQLSSSGQKNDRLQHNTCDGQ